MRSESGRTAPAGFEGLLASLNIILVRAAPSMRLCRPPAAGDWQSTDPTPTGRGLAPSGGRTAGENGLIRLSANDIRHMLAAPSPRPDGLEAQPHSAV